MTSNKNKVLLIISLLILISIASYFVFSKGLIRSLKIKTVNQTQGDLKEKTEESNNKELIIEADEFSFVPNTISLKKGDTVKLILKNNGGSPHNLVIEKLGIYTEVVPDGGSDTVEFKADNVGVYDFYCSIGNHKSLGMEGTLKIQ